MARITYTKVTGPDYVDARFDVHLDGKRIGQVSRDRRTATHGYANSRLGYTTTATVWYAEEAVVDGKPVHLHNTYSSIDEHRTRKDATIAILERLGHKRLTAYTIVGKRNAY